MAMWHIHSGKYWMIQWCIDWWISIGVHIDLKRRYTGKNKTPYGPYAELHFLFFIISFGYQPYYGTYN
jgi:hypothetical protein